MSVNTAPRSKQQSCYQGHRWSGMQLSPATYVACGLSPRPECSCCVGWKQGRRPGRRAMRRAPLITHNARARHTQLYMHNIKIGWRWQALETHRDLSNSHMRREWSCHPIRPMRLFSCLPGAPELIALFASALLGAATGRRWHQERCWSGDALPFDEGPASKALKVIGDPQVKFAG